MNSAEWRVYHAFREAMMADGWEGIDPADIRVEVGGGSTIDAFMRHAIPVRIRVLIGARVFAISLYVPYRDASGPWLSLMAHKYADRLKHDTAHDRSVLAWCRKRVWTGIVDPRALAKLVGATL